MELTRRNVAKTTPAVILGLAGCMGSDDSGDVETLDGDETSNNEPTDSDGDGVPDDRDDYPNDTDRSTELRDVSTTRNIQEDQWYSYGLNFTEPGYIEYDFVVRDGPAIDVILMDEEEYSSYEEGERFRAYNDLSAYDSAGERIDGGPLSEGSYRLIFDNSEFGDAAPPTDFDNNVAEVEIDITTSQ